MGLGLGLGSLLTDGAAECGVCRVDFDVPAVAVSVPVRGLGRRSAALVGPPEGWLVASKRLGALPKAKRGVLGRG